VKKARTLNVRFYLASTGSFVLLLFFITGDGVKPTAPFVKATALFKVQLAFDPSYSSEFFKLFVPPSDLSAAYWLFLI